MKPNNKLSYVHRQSNHPPTLLKNIPLNINKRLTNSSSSKEVFDESIGNLSIDNEIDDDDVCEPRWTGYRVSVSARKTKLKHFNLGSSTDFSLVYPFLVIMAFRDVRNLLLLSHDDGTINDEEFLVVNDLYVSKNADFPYDLYTPFDLEELDESECLAEFRFRKRDIPRLNNVLQIPDTLTCNQRSVCDGVEGLCMLLKRLSYPCRYGDMIFRFAKPVPVLSMVTNQMIDYVYNTHGHKVLQWNHQVLSLANLQSYVDAITAKGAPLPNCFGFIDGTVRPISRSGEHQRILYNGQKRVHALKFQSVALPNGLIGNLYGPFGKL